MNLSNKTEIVSWKELYSYDKDAIKRNDKYLEHHKYAMEINEFQNTNMITLETLRKDLKRFIAPQMYYFIDDTELLSYLEKNLSPEGEK